MRFLPGCSCCGGADCEGCCVADPPDGPPDTLQLTVTAIGGANCICVTDYTLTEVSQDADSRGWSYTGGCAGVQDFVINFVCNCSGGTVNYFFEFLFTDITGAFGFCEWTATKDAEAGVDTCSPFYVDFGEVESVAVPGFDCSANSCGGGPTTYRFEFSE